jgi:hypothetical protein
MARALPDSRNAGQTSFRPVALRGCSRLDFNVPKRGPGAVGIILMSVADNAFGLTLGQSRAPRTQENYQDKIQRSAWGRPPNGRSAIFIQIAHYLNQIPITPVAEHPARARALPTHMEGIIEATEKGAAIAGTLRA